MTEHLDHHTPGDDEALPPGGSGEIGMNPGDTVIFSSKLIPGNEHPVERLHRRLRGLGIALITHQDAQVHRSGHPAEDDLRRL